LNAATKELAAVEATPDDVTAKAAQYRKTFNGAALTPQALVNNWTTLDAVTVRPHEHSWESNYDDETDTMAYRCRDCGAEQEVHA
jgi:hypothetical protein